MIIANDSIYSNVLKNIQRNQVELDRLNQQVSSGLAFRFPHEEPVKAVTSMQLRSDIVRLKKFNENIVDAKSTMEATDAALGSAVEILQRVRELSVQAATGTLNESDRANMALEINQLLEEMVAIGNTEFQGKFIFSGSETLNESFNESPFVVDRIGGNIVKVDYKGDRHERNREIAENRFVSMSLPGNRAFAGANQEITMGYTGVASATTALSTYIGSSSGYFRVDGKEIYYDTSVDSLQAISDRINQANLEVRSSIVTVAGSSRLKIETTNPHQMELLDIDRTAGTSKVDGLLDDLQIVEGNSYSLTDPNQPDNIDSSAIENHISVFQAMINLRDDMDVNIAVTNPDFVKRVGSDTNGDGVGDLLSPAALASAIAQAPLRIGGSNLTNLDAALDNLLTSRSVFGARLNRLESAEGRNIDFEQNTEKLLARTEDVDMAKVLIEFQEQQNIQKAALSVGARIFSLSLLDFM